MRFMEKNWMRQLSMPDIMLVMVCNLPIGSIITLQLIEQSSIKGCQIRICYGALNFIVCNVQT